MKSCAYYTVYGTTTLFIFLGAIDLFCGGKGHVAAIGCIIFTILILLNKKIGKKII